MPPVVIDVRQAEDSRDVVHLAVQALAEGKIVAFPTETVYGLAASALDEAAVARLLEIKGRDPSKPFALAIKSLDEALDYVPTISPLGERLARRCWPGPVTLVLDTNHPDSLITQLPPGVRQAVSPNGSIGLRVVGHLLMIDVLRMLAGPVALTSANLSGQPEAITAQEVVDRLGDKVHLVLDDGRCRFGQSSTVVRVADNQFQILRSGVVTEATLKRLASLFILFVCTGNTCRSPMAEALCRQMIAQRLGCRMEELSDRGVLIESAGLAAIPGGRANQQAIDVMADYGLSLAEHQSQPLTDQLVRHADLIVTMTRGHRDAIVGQWPEAAGRVCLLRSDEGDVSDPIGGTSEDYRQCARQIASALEELTHKFPLPDA